MLNNDSLIDPNDRAVLRAYIADTYGFYYYSRGKLNASLKYLQTALKIHSVRKEWDHYAKVLLHICCVHSRLKDHDSSVHALSSVLQLVEDHKLEDGGSSAQKICMIAICYHNLAIEQLHQHEFQQACIASQNARRLARLSLSYSNRWLKQFERTHETVLQAVSVKCEEADLEIR